jgi:hypothetical protein
MSAYAWNDAPQASVFALLYEYKANKVSTRNFDEEDTTSCSVRRGWRIVRPYVDVAFALCSRKTQGGYTFVPGLDFVNSTVFLVYYIIWY